MQLKFSLVILAVLFASVEAHSQSPDEQSSSGFSSAVHDNEHDSPADDVVQKISELSATVARLEKKIDRLAARPSEFTHVEVRVVDQQGSVRAGFDVRLNSVGDVQSAEASGISDEEGLGLVRHLPYGKYWVTITGHGWYARDLVTLEVGKPLDLIIVAPAANWIENLDLDASLRIDAVRNLAFGKWEVKTDTGWGNRLVPDPDDLGDDEDSNDWKSFPTLSDGAEHLALSVRFSVKRKIEQPDGSNIYWEWRGGKAAEPSPHLHWLVQADGTIQPILKVVERHKVIQGDNRWFRRLASEEKQGETVSLSDKRLGYYRLKLGESRDGSEGIALPVGEIELDIDEIYARPSAEVLASIDAKEESSLGQIWLQASVQRGGHGWFTKLLGESPNATSPNLTKKIVLKLGEKQTIKIGPEGGAL